MSSHTPHRRTLTQRKPENSSLIGFFFKGTVTQSDGLEDLGDDCKVKMRSQAGLAVSPASERRQPLAPRAMGKPSRATLPPLKGVCATTTMGQTV